MEEGENFAAPAPESVGGETDEDESHWWGLVMSCDGMKGGYWGHTNASNGNSPVFSSFIRS